MATRALTAMAGAGSSAPGSVRKTPIPTRKWRQIFASQDASAIWHHLFDIVSDHVEAERAAEVTQELFLGLLASGRMDSYASGDWREDEIDRDLTRMLATA